MAGLVLVSQTEVDKTVPVLEELPVQDGRQMHAFFTWNIWKVLHKPCVCRTMEANRPDH